jgi:hypothetical protein
VARKRYTIEQIITNLREVEVQLDQAARRVSPRISTWYKSTSPVGDTNLFENIWERPMAQVRLAAPGDLEWSVRYFLVVHGRVVTQQLL